MILIPCWIKKLTVKNKTTHKITFKIMNPQAIIYSELRNQMMFLTCRLITSRKSIVFSKTRMGPARLKEPARWICSLLEIRMSQLRAMMRIVGLDLLAHWEQEEWAGLEELAV